MDFSKACNEEKGFLLFTKEELVGVPADVVNGYPVEGDKLKITFKTPDIVPVFQYADLPATRRAAYLGYEGKTLSNVPVLDEIVKLRRDAAQLLGKRNHAEYVLEVRMAKTPETVFAFLKDLETKLRPLGLKEREKLLQLKKETHADKGYDFDGVFYLWDYRYYDRLWTEKTLALDDNHVKQFFQVDEVVPKILDLYRRLLNVQFFPVPRTEEAGGITWHDEAEMYAVYDAGKGEVRGPFLGYMHLDLYPRENKYGHAAVWGLVPGWTGRDGERHYPVVNMVGE